jgi:hypothetical protein
MNIFFEKGRCMNIRAMLFAYIYIYTYGIRMKYIDQNNYLVESSDSQITNFQVGLAATY